MTEEPEVVVAIQKVAEEMILQKWKTTLPFSFLVQDRRTLLQRLE
jgi:hypothetical protein